MNILFVENHNVFADIVTKEFLQSHEVCNVPDIKKALFEIGKRNFDIILMDYDLDDGKGTELIAEIRRRDIPIVIIAVSAHERGNKMLLWAGADAVCPKTNFKNINKVIENTLGNLSCFA